MEYSCTLCKDTGYLDIDPNDIYCDCNAGAFYEARDELNLQKKCGLLDDGTCSISSDYLHFDEDCNYEDYEEYLLYTFDENNNCYYLSQLPFYYRQLASLADVSNDEDDDEDDDDEGELRFFLERLGIIGIA